MGGQFRCQPGAMISIGNVPPRLRCGDEVALLGRGLGAVVQDVGLTGEL